VFVLVANALDNMPGELEDASAILGGKAWTTARRVTIPLALPALIAGALIAFLQAMTLFGSPAILALPGRLHTMTTKIWSLFQYPPKPELAAAAVAAPDPDHPVAAGPENSCRAPRLFGGRRQIWRAAPCGNGKVALGGVGVLSFYAAQSGVPAVFRAAQRRAFAQRHNAGDACDHELHKHRLCVHRIVVDAMALKNTVILGTATATIGTLLRWSSPMSPRARRSPAPGCSAFSPPRRSPFPASCSASDCS